MPATKSQNEEDPQSQHQLHHHQKQGEQENDKSKDLSNQTKETERVIEEQQENEPQQQQQQLPNPKEETQNIQVKNDENPKNDLQKESNSINENEEQRLPQHDVKQDSHQHVKEEDEHPMEIGHHNEAKEELHQNVEVKEEYHEQSMEIEKVEEKEEQNETKETERVIEEQQENEPQQQQQQLPNPKEETQNIQVKNDENPKNDLQKESNSINENEEQRLPQHDVKQDSHQHVKEEDEHPMEIGHHNEAKEELHQNVEVKEESHEQSMEIEKVEEKEEQNEENQQSLSLCKEEKKQQGLSTTQKSASITNISHIINEYINIYQKIETLENEIHEFTIKKRRRICNLFDIHPLYRQSHLRLFLNHQLLQEAPQEDGTTSSGQWKLMLEGSLIVGYDENASKKLISGNNNASNSNASSSTENVDDNNPDNVDDEMQNDNHTTKQQQQQQSTMKKPIIFTHFFEKIEVTFRPYVPPPTGTKKSSSSSKRRKLNDSYNSFIPDNSSGKYDTKLVWTRSEGGTNRPTPDAHAFHATYNETSTNKGSSTIIADILLYRHLHIDLELYQPSQVFINLLLPKYYPEKNMKSSSSKLNHTHHMPCTFTFKEIVMIIYTYIQIHNLQDVSDQSVIHNDRIFMELFGCKQLQWSSLKYLLFERKLITKLEDYDVPIHIQYIMNDTAHDESLSAKNRNSLHSYSFDIDIYLPSPFHAQIREILLRIKNRELAYTSSRTKAVKLLTAARGDEDNIKQLMEEIIHHSDCTSITSALTQKKILSREHVPILLALEKSSTDGSEAKTGVGIDVKLVYLMDKLLERCDRLECCWEVMEESLNVS